MCVQCELPNEMRVFAAAAAENPIKANAGGSVALFPPADAAAAAAACATTTTTAATATAAAK